MGHDHHRTEQARIPNAGNAAALQSVTKCNKIANKLQSANRHCSLTKKVAVWLTHLENYQTHDQADRALLYAPPPLTSKPFFCCVSDRSCRYEEPRELDNRISLYMVLVKQYVSGVGGWF